jgi:hypothetical protein
MPPGAKVVCALTWPDWRNVLLLLPYIVSLDIVKAQTVAHVEDALRRRIEVRAVRLRILSGLEVSRENLSVFNL